MFPRTDLAAELHLRHHHTPSGVILQEESLDSVRIQRLEVQTEAGAKALGKPVGRYRTLTLPRNWQQEPRVPEEFCRALARELAALRSDERRVGKEY